MPLFTRFRHFLQRRNMTRLNAQAIGLQLITQRSESTRGHFVFLHVLNEIAQALQHGASELRRGCFCVLDAGKSTANVAQVIQLESPCIIGDGHHFLTRIKSNLHHSGLSPHQTCCGRFSGNTYPSLTLICMLFSVTTGRV
ncbi:hypothetical protein K8374_25270 (plasmid) [Pseudomonas sp. p1(2021b)]|uniref:hypothetical protein n=1 Tax=Pseudomonas sp. p1(2021b) TaxID=2874628 RepID=UPI001CCA7EBA|nr:hypothetical protein [Pseudomonas sp. p1(2021b)]UBM27820.1 hypothetical protein K8374_25270 [Pseudomonas sp. p1(2021b)]